ncbi:MAG: glycosyltransferase family 4 protein [Propionibacteriaceae bacterium]|jgi:glycosyltransferase involved in cell wall biosynthesis|nr:glycosyltransferase family 4 protein [Propionibacteriaceae bacterium]
MGNTPTPITTETLATLPAPGRIGYVLKMYPRFSETFILTELLSHQAAGLDIEVFSLRYPIDGRFHAELAEMGYPVTYLIDHHRLARERWEALQEYARHLPTLKDHLDDFLQTLGFGDAVQAAELAVMAKKRGITHLHAHFASISTSVARVAAQLAGITYSFTAHAKDIFHEEVDNDDLRRKLEGANAVVAISQFNDDYLRDTFGESAANVHMIHNGLDLRKFPYQAPEKRQPVFATVGRLVEKKGFDDLIDAVKILVDEGRTFTVEIVGTGPLTKQLKEHRDRLGLTDIIRMPGALPQHEVASIVSQAACFPCPCVLGSDGNRDGLPTVVLEAMALGTPVIGTPVTGLPEVVRDDDTGLMVPEHDPAALARAMARLLDEPDLRVRLAGNARKLIEAEFDTVTQAAEVALCFRAPAPAQRSASA